MLYISVFYTYYALFAPSSQGGHITVSSFVSIRSSVWQASEIT